MLWMLPLSLQVISFIGRLGEVLLPRARDQTVLRLGLAVLCGNKQVASFELTLNPIVEND